MKNKVTLSLKFNLNRVFMTHYKILGIKKTATTTEIKAKRDQLAKIYHPDKNKAFDACDKMKNINEAYEVLSNTTKRAEYDKKLEGSKQNIETKFKAEYHAIGLKIRKKQKDIALRVDYLLTILPGIEKADQAEVLNPLNMPPLLTTIIGYGNDEMLEQILPYYTKEELLNAIKIKDEDELDGIEHLGSFSDKQNKLLFSQFNIEERWNIIEPYVKNNTLILPISAKTGGMDKTFFDDSLYFAELDAQIKNLQNLNTIMSIPFADALMILREDLFNFAEKQRKNNIPLIELQQMPEMQLLRDTITLVRNISPNAVINYQNNTKQQSYSEPNLLLRVIALITITAASFVLGGLIGIGIGMLAGAWTGPGAAITAVVGLVKGAMSGAAIGLTIGTAVTGTTVGATMGYLFFKPHKLVTDIDNVILTANNYSDEKVIF